MIRLFSTSATLSCLLWASSVSAQELELFEGDKLILTNAVSTIEGPSGGGLATWATIAGLEMDDGIGIQGHVTIAELADYGWESHGVAVGIKNRVELSYARQNLDTRDVGAALGLGQGYSLNQDVFAAKVRLFGDLVYGEAIVPQVSVGIQHKRNLDGPVALAVGAAQTQGTDYTLSATKLFLRHSVLVNTTVRYTKANEAGLLGFGSASGNGYRLQFEGSVAYQFSRRGVFGAEFRTKPDNLGFGEDDWVDLFAAYAVTENVTLTAAYIDLGTIATFENQRGALVSAQVAF